MRRMIPVWDLAVRVLHWTLVLSVATAWLTRLDVISFERFPSALVSCVAARRCPVADPRSRRVLIGLVNLIL